jgi:hypothetical protein
MMLSSNDTASERGLAFNIVVTVTERGDQFVVIDAPSPKFLLRMATDQVSFHSLLLHHTLAAQLAKECLIVECQKYFFVVMSRIIVAYLILSVLFHITTIFLNQATV